MIMTGLARLGRDPEVRFTSGGKAVMNLAMAFNLGWGENQRTTWVKATMWGERAEKLAPYLAKGSLISVIMSEIELESYEGRDGKTYTNLIARVDQIEFAGKKEGSGETQAKPKPKPKPKPVPKKESPKLEDFDDDDIPF